MNTAVRTVSRCGRRQCILSVNAGVVFSRIRSKHVQISLRLFSGMSPRRNITVQAESSGSTVKADEVSKFERMASSWWDDVDGQMKELHSMNRLRVPLIRDGLLQSSQKHGSKSPRPLEGFKILDIGCGGGVLCEPLGRLGATVKGLDPGQENISVAIHHLPEDLRDRVSYDCASIEDFSDSQSSPDYDAVVMSEVIEHVENPDQFVRAAAEVLKPGGSLFLTTLNRTVESWLGAIVAWEYFLRKLPIGTHEWQKFQTPQEIEKILKAVSLRTILVHGMCYNPVNNTWKWSNQQAVNYALHAVKDV